MKLNSIIMTALLCIYFSSSIAQNTATWTTYNNSGITFKLPGDPDIISSFGVDYYGSSVSDEIAIQVHISDNAQLEPDNEIWSRALANEDDNTLRAMADMILLATNAQATEVKESNVSGFPCMELGLRYAGMTSNEPFHTFMKYFIYGGKFYSFSITIAESQLNLGLDYKSSFFDAIDFNY